MWELSYKESWTPRNWCFWTVVLEKTFKSPLDCKEIQPVNPKVNQSEYSLEGLMLMLKLQFFGYLMGRTDSLEKTLMLGKIESRRRRQQRIRCLDGITDLMDMSLSQLQEFVMPREAWLLQSTGSQRVRHNWATVLNWTCCHRIDWFDLLAVQGLSGVMSRIIVIELSTTDSILSLFLF